MKKSSRSVMIYCDGARDDEQRSRGCEKNHNLGSPLRMKMDTGQGDGWWKYPLVAIKKGITIRPDSILCVHWRNLANDARYSVFCAKGTLIDV
jgi:hypothetical protein